MRKSTHKKFVQDHLKLMFSSVKHYSQIEREVEIFLRHLLCTLHFKAVYEQILVLFCHCHLLQGCAIGTGFCAASHLDMVVEQLEHVIKEDMVRKGKSLFGLVKVSE